MIESLNEIQCKIATMTVTVNLSYTYTDNNSTKESKTYSKDL